MRHRLRVSVPELPPNSDVLDSRLISNVMLIIRLISDRMLTSRLISDVTLRNDQSTGSFKSSVWERLLAQSSKLFIVDCGLWSGQG